MADSDKDRDHLPAARGARLRQVETLEEDDGVGLQMSFTDLMSLLLVFFIVLFSISHGGLGGSQVKDTAATPAGVNRYSAAIAAAAVTPDKADPEGEARKATLIQRFLATAPAWAEGVVPNEDQNRRQAIDQLGRNLLLAARTELPRLEPNQPGLLNYFASTEPETAAKAANHLIPTEKIVPSPVAASAPQGQDLLLARIKDLKAANPQLDLTLSVQANSVILTVGDRVTFEEGQAEIKPQFRAMLLNLAETLRATPSLSGVRIKGHTDSKPISTPAFPSNWELSGARSARVARLLIDHGLDPKLFEIVGYSEYHPLASNTDERRRAQNRRVEIELVTG